MNWRFERYQRLESATPGTDLQRGFRAEIPDPGFFLGQQWRIGEHQGEDAASPVEVIFTADQIPIDPMFDDPRLDPTIVPPEPLVESETGDWWTPGRRIQLGHAFATQAGLPPIADADPELLLAGLAAPYDRFNRNAYDGYRLWRDNPDHPVFAEVPAPEPPAQWNPLELAYDSEFTAATKKLTLRRHEGGHMDWYAVDAEGPLPVPDDSPPPVRVMPTRMRYPGAPQPRWYQIEDHRVDIGGFAPDRGHFATLLLLDLVVSHSDDWFTFPVQTEAGNIARLREVQVKDSFGDTWTVAPPDDWTMFGVRGLAHSSLLVWPTVTSPLTGGIVEDVLMGIDEDANLLWAVERRVDGHDLPTEGLEPATTAPSDSPVDGSARAHYRFRASQGLRKYWHPYVIQDIDSHRRFVQARAADLSSTPPQLFPEPQARVLYDLDNLSDDPAAQQGPVHQIEPAAIPPTGFFLQRRWMLARDANGNPVLWIQRHRKPVGAPPISSLHFDVFQEIATTVEQ